MVTESEVMANTNSFNISWLGSSGVTNGAVVEQKNYDGKGLGIEVVVTGTTTWGVASSQKKSLMKYLAESVV